MKKLLTLLIVAALPAFVFAQHFGVQAGGSLSNMKYKTDLFTYNSKIKPSFFMGLTVDIPLNNTMVLNTALNYKNAGTWIHENKDILAVRLNYINLDITYNYLIPVGDLMLFAEGGGYIAYALGGKWIYKPDEGSNEEEKINFGTSEADDMKPLDVGLIIGGGIYFGKAKFGFDYNPGLLNLSTYSGETLRNWSISLKAAYLINRK